MFLPLWDNLPKTKLPFVTFVLMAINVAIFFLVSSNPIDATNSALLYGAVPYELTNSGTQCLLSPDGAKMICGTTAEMQAIYPSVDFPPTWITVFTSMFLHGDIFHLLGNMLFLFVFGRALENAMGRLSFSIFYLLGGLAADMGHTLWEPASMLPGIGASGAIAAVMAGYIVLFPSARIMSLFIIFPMRVRAIWVIGSWIFIQFIDAYVAAGAGVGSGIAYWAHIGGFVAGAALTYLLVGADQRAEYRRNARVAGGFMVDPLVPYEPEITHPAFVSPAPQRPMHVPPDPFAPPPTPAPPTPAPPTPAPPTRHAPAA